jgi:serine/threonine protein kinase
VCHNSWYTIAKNPIYYFPFQTEREVNVYSTLTLGQTEEDAEEEYSHLSLRTVPSLDTPSQVERMYSHLATEPFWEPPTQKDALYNTLSTKRFLEIPRSSILCSEVIGSGAFGTVHQGEWKVGETELEVGIKMVRDPSSGDHLSLLRQAAVMGQFSHPSIVNLYGVVSIGKPTMLVMELMKGGQLDTFLDTLDKTEDHKDLFLSFSSQLVDGACYLEGKGFIHRDLAAHSILLNGDHTVCKISNFGLSRGLGEQDYYAINGGNIPIKWTSPETLLYRKHSHASDVWSFGMLLYEVWSVGGLPFENWTVEEILKGLHDNYHHPIPETCPQDIYQIMLRCWNYKAEERPTFAELKEQISNI